MLDMSISAFVRKVNGFEHGIGVTADVDTNMRVPMMIVSEFVTLRATSGALLLRGWKAFRS